MLVSLAGAMSTGELGLSLAEMIRRDKVGIISCTGANLEEDIFNLVAHDYYERVPHYRDLTPADEKALLDRHMNRVTDTCIPEMEAMRRLEKAVLEEWMAADAAGERLDPHGAIAFDAGDLVVEHGAVWSILDAALARSTGLSDPMRIPGEGAIPSFAEALDLDVLYPLPKE
jgi:deoxyhypusine synthase